MDKRVHKSQENVQGKAATVVSKLRSSNITVFFVLGSRPNSIDCKYVII
jgi:hypothetical protein